VRTVCCSYIDGTVVKVDAEVEFRTNSAKRRRTIRWSGWTEDLGHIAKLIYHRSTWSLSSWQDCTPLKPDDSGSEYQERREYDRRAYKLIFLALTQLLLPIALLITSKTSAIAAFNSAGTIAPKK